MADIVIENTENKIKVQQLSDWEVRILNLPYAKSPQKQYRISNDKTIKICPLWAYEKGGNDIINNTLALPIAPSDIMFDNESDTQTLKLMNFGELPVNVNRKLATWSVTSVFPKLAKEEGQITSNNGWTSKSSRYWFDLSNDNGQGMYNAYGADNGAERGYCETLYDWKVAQTPLVFMYKTWGTYYYCQIKSFKFGEKDNTGFVYYELQFQEYKKYDRYDKSYASTDYESDTYYVDEGDTILSIAKKIYGSTDRFVDLMELNDMKNPEVHKGDKLKIK